jgi:hypothetical protein
MNNAKSMMFNETEKLIQQMQGLVAKNEELENELRHKNN